VVHARTDAADVLSLVGDLDIAAAPRFVTQAADALRSGAKQLLIELDGVGFVDSAGLAALVNVLRRATAARAGLVLCGTQPQVLGVLARTRLEREFTFAASIEDIAA
jgi:anti-sigma B factor antagonist